ncbi:MAG: XdhC/CoxI family protein [Gammaproteobacteria bacterium]|nr:XdhC/CoxI family protein [Gammaproteobacteria bacterium]
MTQSVAEIASLKLDRRDPAVLLTVIKSVPQSALRLGHKSILSADGRPTAPFGGGELESAILKDAAAALESRQHRLRYYEANGLPSTRRNPDAIGIYFESLIPRDHLIIVGAGHIGVAVSSIAGKVGFEITVIDDRSDYANRERFPEADRVVAKDIESALAEIDIDQETYVVLVTRAHAFDETALRLVLDSDARYIGMIGSTRRVLVVYKRLVSEGFPPESLSKVYAPIGLDFGASTPDEIGLAIVAELIAVKRGGKASSLRLHEWQRYLGSTETEYAAAE